MEHESDGYTNYNLCTRYCHQKISKGIEGIGNNSMSGDHSNYSIIKIGQNTEKSPGYFMRLAVTQTPVKDNQLTLMWKSCKM